MRAKSHKRLGPLPKLGDSSYTFSASECNWFEFPYDPMPVSVRQIPPNRRSVTGFRPSVKSGRLHAFESALERDLMTLLEFDGNVDRFAEQPCKITYRGADGRNRTHVPDILAIYRSEDRPPPKPVLYQVKYRADLFENWPRLHPGLRAAARYARTQKWRFRIMTEVEIRTARLENAQFLLPYMRCAPDDDDELLLIATLKKTGEVNAESLLLSIYRGVENRARLIPSLWRLVGRKTIVADLDRPLTMHSVLRCR